ncbi:endonuclease III [bacterium]|nr:endonuclease III [bacterium]
MKPFDIEAVIALVVREVSGEKPLAVDRQGRWRGPPPLDPKAYHPAPNDVKRNAPFRVLVGCLVSLRTKEEVTDPATERLFELADNPRDMAKLDPEKIAKAIYPAGFYNRKGVTIRDVSRRIVEDHGGRVPDTVEELVKLKGVGRKTANLVVTVGHGKPGICVDTHVHRVVNRWGYVRTKSPDKTESALRKKLPPRYWIPINSLLVVFGRNRCQPVSPHCSDCPVVEYCPRVSVTRSR